MIHSPASSGAASALYLDYELNGFPSDESAWVDFTEVDEWQDNVDSLIQEIA